MTFKEIVQLAREIESEIIKDPEKGFKNFRAKWLGLESDEKRLIASPIIDFCNLKLSPDNYIPLPNNLAEQKLCCTGIINFISDEFNGQPWFGTLELGEGIKEVHIAAVFKLI